MKSKILLILSIFVCFSIQGQTVPNTSTFSYQDVVNVVGGTNLIQSYANAIGTFDPAYVGSKNSLYNFRNYQNNCRPIGLPTVNIYYAPGNASTFSGAASNLFGYVQGYPLYYISSEVTQLANYNVGTKVYSGNGVDCSTVSDGFYSFGKTSLNDLIYHIVGGVIVSKETLLKIGTAMGGGILAYVLKNTDLGYVSDYPNGFIAYTASISSLQWWNGTAINIPITYVEYYGQGNINTGEIVYQQGSGSYAAKYCMDAAFSGFTDWYLPSYKEFTYILPNIGHLLPTTKSYWTSSTSQYSSNTLAMYINNPYTGQPIEDIHRSTALFVLALRSFH